jgi:hypothetical protein
MLTINLSYDESLAVLIAAEIEADDLAQYLKDKSLRKNTREAVEKRLASTLAVIEKLKLQLETK